MADLQVSLQLTADDLLSPSVNRSLRAVLALQRGVQQLNGATAQVGAAGAGGGLAQAGQQAQQAQNRVQGLNGALQQLVPQFLGPTGALALRQGAMVGGVVAVGVGIAQVASRTHQMRLETEQARASLLAFAESGKAVDEMMADAQQNAMLTGRSLAEVQAAQASLASVGRTPAQMREMLQLAERLAVLAPEQGVQGAAFAIREASANQFESAVDRMNLSRATINRLRSQGVEGTDVLSRALDEMGVTMADVAKQGEGLEGQTNRMSTAFDGLLKRATDPAWDALERHLKAMNDGLTAGPGGQPTPGQTGLGAVTDVVGFALGATVDSALNLVEKVGQAGLFVVGNTTTAVQNALTIGGQLLGMARDYDWRAHMHKMGFVTEGPGETLTASYRGYQPPVGQAWIDTGLRQMREFRASERDPGGATQAYLDNLTRLDGMDDVLKRQAQGWGGVQSAITAVTNQVDYFQRQVEHAQQASGFVGGLRGSLERARAQMRREGTYGGQYETAITDAYRRENRYTIAEGEAAARELATAGAREAAGGEFAFDQVAVNEQHVTAGTVYINGGASVVGGAQMSGISGSGLPSGGVNGRYAQSRSTWEWAPGVGIGRAIG